MNQVRISVAGRSYTIRCAEGEEEHISGLADLLNAKIAQVGGAMANNLETHNLLFAGLFVADDMTEHKNAHERIAQECADLKSQLESAADTQASAVEAAKSELQTALQARIDAAEAAQKSAEQECENLKQRLAIITELEKELEDARAENAKAKDEIAQLMDQNCTLSEQLLTRASETDAASANLMQVAEGDPNLMPALEKFANLLEECADKLESAYQNP